MDIGFVTFTVQNSQAIDSTQVLLETNISATGTGNSWLFGMNGQLLGIYQTSLSEEQKSSSLSILSIYDEIEKMKTQKNLPCLGIYGQEVTDEISTSYNLPYGIYVTNTVKKGAAYKAGVQNGDVITKMNGESVLTLQTLKSEILKKQSGEEITLTIQRSGADGYKELQLSVKLGKR
jgi:S1-C subfamily serine protease